MQAPKLAYTLPLVYFFWTKCGHAKFQRGGHVTRWPPKATPFHWKRTKLVDFNDLGVNSNYIWHAKTKCAIFSPYPVESNMATIFHDGRQKATLDHTKIINLLIQWSRSMYGMHKPNLHHLVPSNVVATLKFEHGSHCPRCQPKSYYLSKQETSLVDFNDIGVDSKFRNQNVLYLIHIQLSSYCKHPIWRLFSKMVAK